MNFEHDTPLQESFPRISEGMVANMAQLRLMPLGYQLDKGVLADMHDKETRNEVAMWWTSTYAQAFREYIEDNPREMIDLGSEEALIEFFMKLKEYATVH